MGALPKVVKLRGAWAQNDDVPAAIQDPFMGINYRQPFDLTKTRINSCVVLFLERKEAVSKVKGRRNWPPLLSLLLALVLPECRKLVEATRYLPRLTNLVRTHVHGPRGVCSNPPAERGRLSKPRPAETPKRDLFCFSPPGRILCPLCPGCRQPFLAGDLQLFKTSLFFFKLCPSLAPGTRSSTRAPLMSLSDVSGSRLRVY